MSNANREMGPHPSMSGVGVRQLHQRLSDDWIVLKSTRMIRACLRIGDAE